MPPISPFHADDVHNRQVAIAYPDLPADCLSRLEAVITALDQLRTHCHLAADQIQQVMGQTSGAVAQVAAVSQGKVTHALQGTMTLTARDGTTAAASFQEAATHLDTVLPTLSTLAATVQSLMGVYQTLQANGFMVSPVEEDTAQRQMNDLTTALGNFGLALQAIASKVNTLTASMPGACATGVVPWSSAQSTFAPNAFDPLHDSGQGNIKWGKSGKDDDAEKSVKKALKNFKPSSGLPSVAEIDGLLAQYRNAQIAAEQELAGTNDTETQALLREEIRSYKDEINNLLEERGWLSE